MTPKVITAPSAMLTLAELRLHSSLDEVAGANPLDPLLPGYIASAHAYCEHYTGRAFGDQTLEIALDDFPVGGILLPRGATSIVSIKYVNTAGVETTIPNTDYMLDDYGPQAWAIPAYAMDWPEPMATVNAVKVRYQAGDAVLPPAVRSAMLLLAANMIRVREATAPSNEKAVELGVNASLDTVKDWS